MDYSIDPSGFSLTGGDTPDFGSSFDFGGGSDLMSQFNVGDLVDPTLGMDSGAFGAGPGTITQWGAGNGSADASSFDTGAGLTQPQIPTAGYGGAAQVQQPMGGGMGGMLGGLGAPGMLGIGGGIAGLLGTLAGGGLGPKSIQGVPQKAALNQAYGANQQLGQFAQGQSPLQLQQSSMLNALMQGQIPPQLAALNARAYDPAYQDVMTRATNAGRQAGFYDSPATSPVGGAIVGPAAAQLQGQQAQSLLALMQSFPQLLNTPIQQQIGAAQGQAGGFTNLGNAYPMQQQSQLGPQVGQAVGAGLQGAGQGIAQGQQQQFNNSLLQMIMRQQGNSGLSNQSPTPNQFSQYQ